MVNVVNRVVNRVVNWWTRGGHVVDTWWKRGGNVVETWWKRGRFGGEQVVEKVKRGGKGGGN